MKKHLRYAWIGVSAMLVLAGYYAVAVGSAGGIQPVAPKEAADLLAAVRLGCDTATASVSTSAGVVTVHEWHWRDNGQVLETETTYTVASKGERFKAAVETKYLTNEWSSYNTPGTIQKTVLGYDGETVTRYGPARSYAEISGIDSQIGRELRNVKLMAVSPGIGVPRFEGMPPTSDNPNPGPYVLGRQTLNGEDCVVVESSYSTPTEKGTQTMYVRFWLALQKGFSVVKSEGEARGGMFPEKGVLVDQGEAQLREYAGGLWGVSQVQQEAYMVDSSGRLYLKTRTITSFPKDYAINRSVTDEMLAVTLPSGTKVHNELIDTEYTVP